MNTDEQEARAWLIQAFGPTSYSDADDQRHRATILRLLDEQAAWIRDLENEIRSRVEEGR